MVKLIEKIVFSGVDGRVLLPLLIVLIYLAVGQVIAFIDEAQEIWRDAGK